MERKEPLVSIGIPTYNRAASYLAYTLRSVMEQTYGSIEIIVSDNASTDNTVEFVATVADDRIRYLRHRTPITPNANFNACLNAARGKYFLLLHDDDAIDPNFVETCMRAANYSHQYNTIRTGTRVIDSSNATLSEHPNSQTGETLDTLLMAWFTGKTSIYMCSTLFNTQKLKAIGGFYSSHNLLQDVVAISRLAAEGPRLEISDVKASFRKHPDEATFAAKVGAWCDDFFSVLDLVTQLCPDRAEVIREKGSRFFVRLCMSRAKAIKSRGERMGAYLTIARTFGFRNIPHRRVFRELLC